jgi:hypothetical protein
VPGTSRSIAPTCMALRIIRRAPLCRKFLRLILRIQSRPGPLPVFRTFRMRRPDRLKAGLQTAVSHASLGSEYRLQPAQVFKKKRPGVTPVSRAITLSNDYFLIRPNITVSVGVKVNGLVAPGTSWNGPVTEVADCSVPPPVQVTVKVPLAFFTKPVILGCSPTG